MTSRKASGLPEPAAGALGAFLNRPDHLTRAAQELARWDEALTLASEAAIGNSFPVIRVNAAGRGAPFLTRHDDALMASAAITRAVTSSGHAK